MRFKNITSEICENTGQLLVYARDTKYGRTVLLGHYDKPRGWKSCYADLYYMLTDDQLTEIWQIINTVYPDVFYQLYYLNNPD